jgi:cytochrome c553
MGIIKQLRRGIVAAFLGCCMSYFATAGERPSGPEVVVRYCSGCHGVDGNSQLPYIPRLAGLSSTYQEGKLAKFRAANSLAVDEAFARFIRPSAGKPDKALTAAAAIHMVGIANGVAEDDLKVAARWYSTQEPASAKNSKGKAFEEGRNLYMDGLQSRGVPACQQCHGLEGHGTDRAPRLAGQHASYVIAQLTHFRTGDQNQSPMTNIARSLNHGQAQAIAKYLQSR